MPDALHIVDGTQDFSGGIDSSKVTTIQSESNPNGLARNELAYLVNGTVRDGAILPRTGWTYVKTIVPRGNLFQGGIMYEPENADPYLLLSLSGHIIQVPCSVAADTDLSATFGLLNPPLEKQAYFVQGEQFAVIQAGDYLTTKTLPLFWDGAILRRSIGIVTATPTPNPGQNELPAAGPMDYYMGRLWYAQDRYYSAGDIVQGTSGTAGYTYRDSILNVTENPLAIGGDGFIVPTNAGSIRALRHSANLDSALGEGQLFIFTTKSIYTIAVPVTRTDWIAAGTTNPGTDDQPLQKVVQITNGAVGDRSVVPVNGDLFYQSLEPGIRSLITAIRYFNQWGNTPISANLERLLNFQDRALMRFSTGIEFENRLLMGMRPIQTDAGVAHQAIVSLDFTPVASFAKKLPPCWEGHWEGLKVLQLFQGLFGGRQRAFAVAVSDTDGSIQLWELTNFERTDINLSGEARVTMVVEFPAFNWGDPFQLKKLVTAELWLDKLIGTVDFTMEYRPDAEVCWFHWHTWQLCSQKTPCDDPLNPQCYPETQFRESHRSTITLPKPPLQCQTPMKRPASQGYQFQCRLTIKGWCRVRGLLLHAETMGKSLYKDMVCFVPPAVAPVVVPPTPPSGNTFITSEADEIMTTESGDQFVL